MWDLIVSVPDHCLSFYFTSFFPRSVERSCIMNGAQQICQKVCMCICTLEAIQGGTFSIVALKYIAVFPCSLKSKC